MQELKSKTDSRSYSILFALLAFFGVGLILFPIVFVIFDRYFKLYLFGSPPPDAWKNDTLVFTTFFLWLILSGVAGGYMQAFKCRKMPHIFAWFPLIGGLTAVLFLNTDIQLPEFMMLVGVMILGSLGSLLGSWLGLKQKRKKEGLKLEART